MNLYAVYDCVDNRYYQVVVAPTDASVCYNNLPFLTRAKPIQDLKIFQIASFDDTTGALSPLEVRREVDLRASYKFEESVMEDMRKSSAQRENEIYIQRQKLVLAKQQAELDRARVELENVARRGDVPQDGITPHK